MTLKSDQYDGLGRLLSSAGVSPVEAETMVAHILATDAEETRERLARILHSLVSDELDRLDCRHNDMIIDIQRVIVKIRSDLEMHRRATARSYTFVIRFIAASLLTQSIMVGSVLFSIYIHSSSPPIVCGTPSHSGAFLPSHAR